ncbi:putative tripeptidyl-peptidase SED2 [Escovopsis weberi]|uniref:tripeptidyl-peptidase II n=1 Tax=Escovopsis weberi TaxID=150374 RepID=A0A0M8N8R4_ESCWE|nr:putative tripeptidyl-peptidase SED2 [Escovopsis weberi]
MFNFKTSILLLGAASLTLGKPSQGVSAPAGHALDLITISIGLTPEGHDGFEQTLFKISDPSDPSYGQFLSQEQAKALLKPSDESTSLTLEWLSGHGIDASSVSDQGQFIDVQLTMDQAIDLLGVHHQAIAQPGDAGVLTTEESLPQELQGHVATIYRQLGPTVGEASNRPRRRSPFFRMSPFNRDVSVPPTCINMMTPACVRQLYNFIGVSAAGDDPQILGIPGFDGQVAQFSQLQEFLAAFAPDQADSNFTFVLLNGGSDTQGDSANIEAALDTQIAGSLADNVPVRFFSTGGQEMNVKPDLDYPINVTGSDDVLIEPYLAFARSMLDLPDDRLPSVISISYGVNEQILAPPYARQVCDILGQLGLRGASVLAASGDAGPGASCETPAGAPRFLPTFPASCPYITAVGATEGAGPEFGATFSSGGFSDVFARPAYQGAAVDQFLGLLGGKFGGLFNPAGRAFPDVAAEGSGFPVFDQDQLFTGQGTSASAPVLASIISLLNDQRRVSGKPRLGFLNPWIYSAGRPGFRDIPQGGSMGCQGQSLAGLPSTPIPGAGWDSVAGWDPCTGVGTPIFDQLSTLV